MSDAPMINEEEIAQYLHAHPKFFEHHPSLLADMYLPSPHGSGTVSLAERQQLAQRDKIRILDSKLAELIQFGEQNDAISEKVHRLSLVLLANNEFAALIEQTLNNLRVDFAVPYVGLRLWTTPKDSNNSAHTAFGVVDEELRHWTNSLVEPYCGHRPGLALDSWFNGADFSGLGEPKSFALIPIQGEQVVGLLALASEDAGRFFPEMGTMYLKRIGEMISAGLLCHINNI